MAGPSSSLDAPSRAFVGSSESLSEKLFSISEERRKEMTAELVKALVPVLEEHGETFKRIEEAKQEIDSLNKQIEDLSQNIDERNAENTTLYRQLEEEHRLRAELKERRSVILIELDKANQLIAEGQAQIELGLAQKARAEELKIEAAQHGREAARLSESAAQHKENAAHHHAKAAQHHEKAAQHHEKAAQHHEKAAQIRTEVTQHRAKAAQIRADVADKAKPLICKYFLLAFGVKDPATITKLTDHIYSEYLSSREITAGKDADGKPVFQINDTLPFIRFSQANPSLKGCNLTPFTIVNAAPLASYLASVDCTLATILVSNKISSEAKQLLEESAAKRGGSLTIKVLTAPASTSSASSR